MFVEHDIGTCVRVSAHRAGHVLFQYNYEGKPKPWCFPVATLNGQQLALYEPSDHLWHRGLWFTFKFLDDINFWEEQETFGRQQTTAWVQVETVDDNCIRILTTLAWIRPDSSDPELREERAITVTFHSDHYTIDWNTRLTATRDIVLDRTPYTTWGGYGGMSFRGTRSWLVNRFLLGGTQRNTERPAGARAPWAEMSGPVDGGDRLYAGVAIFDHIENPRHPSPWYAGGVHSGNFLNAALLFHEPLHLERDVPLDLSYRVVVHDDEWDDSRIQGAWEAWQPSARKEASNE